MKSPLLVTLILLGLIATRGNAMSGCSAIKAPLCGAVTGLSQDLATTVSNACSCNQTAVAASFFSVLNVAGTCTVGGPIASLICPSAVDAISAFVSSRLNQSSWQCTGFSNPTCGGGLMAALQAACLVIPVAHLK